MLIETDYRALALEGQEGAGHEAGMAATGNVVVIGNFDGVHPGHQALLARAKELAASLECGVTVLTFDPHPRTYFNPDQPAYLLTDAVQKHELLQTFGADAIVSLKFDADLANLSAEEFCEQVLYKGLCARHVLVGENFVFGKARLGNVGILENAGREFGFGVTAMPAFNDAGGQRLSSERIRQALRAGETDVARALLGRPWQIRGMVMDGEKRGRTIGFPTANLEMDSYLLPAFGVYAAEITNENDTQTYTAVLNIGRRPTVGSDRPLLEAHLLDFTGDLYGRTLRVNLGAYLRPEQKFAGLAELKDQIAKDVAWARELTIIK